MQPLPLAQRTPQKTKIDGVGANWKRRKGQIYCIDPSRSAAVPGTHFAWLQAQQAIISLRSLQCLQEFGNLLCLAPFNCKLCLQAGIDLPQETKDKRLTPLNNGVLARRVHQRC